MAETLDSVVVVNLEIIAVARLTVFDGGAAAVGDETISLAANTATDITSLRSWIEDPC